MSIGRASPKRRQKKRNMGVIGWMGVGIDKRKFGIERERGEGGSEEREGTRQLRQAGMIVETGDKEKRKTQAVGHTDGSMMTRQGESGIL